MAAKKIRMTIRALNSSIAGREEDRDRIDAMADHKRMSRSSYIMGATMAQVARDERALAKEGGER